MSHCNNCSFCPPWLPHSQRKGRGCAIVYINPEWGWGRSEEARGGGGPFSSSAQHKPVRKQADSFNNINERQTSGEQALRLWGPAGPSHREIFPPLPTLQNLDMCLLKEGGWLLYDCNNRNEQEITKEKVSFRHQCSLPVWRPSLNNNCWESAFGFIKKEKGFL